MLAAAPTPAPKELWEAYPHKSDDTAALPRAASRTASPPSASRGDGGGTSAPLIAGAAVLAFSAGLLLGMLRRRRETDGGPPEPAPDAAPVPAPLASGRFAPRRDELPPAGMAAGPAHGMQASRAANGVRPAERTTATALAAPPANGAPAGPPAAQPRRAALPPPPSSTRPRPAAPTPPAARSRLPAPPPPPLAPRAPWPAASMDKWRCEITWRSGYLRSEFRAQASPPDSRRKTVVLTSCEFKNLMKDPADIPRPELAKAVRKLVVALEEQGWRPVAPGGRWYSRRFVWTHDGPPPGVE